MTSSDEDAVADLTYFILFDVALTQKILRLSNTVRYRTVSGIQVTTIARAIYLLGFNTVRDCALAMLLVERLSSAKHSHVVRAELVKALYASVTGCEMARSSKRSGAEEAAIAALFANIGQVLVATYDYPNYAEIASLVENEKIAQDPAGVKIMGLSDTDLTENETSAQSETAGIHNELLMNPTPVASEENEERHPSGKLVKARDRFIGRRS